MVKNKTTYNDADVLAFIDSFSDTPQKKADSLQLIDLLKEWSGEEPRMWGPSIVGFGNYHYRYASGHEGDAPMLGFSPRKGALSLYIYSDTERSRELLGQLGKYKMGKACIYVKKLSDIDAGVLKELAEESIKYLNEHYECSCRVR